MRALGLMDFKRNRIYYLVSYATLLVFIYLETTRGSDRSFLVVGYLIAQFASPEFTQNQIATILPISRKQTFGFRFIYALSVALIIFTSSSILFLVLNKTPDYYLTAAFSSYLIFLMIGVIKTFPASTGKRKKYGVLYILAVIGIVCGGVWLVMDRFYFPMERYVYIGLFGTIIAVLSLGANYHFYHRWGYKYSTK